MRIGVGLVMLAALSDLILAGYVVSEKSPAVRFFRILPAYRGPGLAGSFAAIADATRRGVLEPENGRR
jgi:hypothetical protein